MLLKTGINSTEVVEFMPYNDLGGKVHDNKLKLITIPHLKKIHIHYFQDPFDLFHLILHPQTP